MFCRMKHDSLIINEIFINQFIQPMQKNSELSLKNSGEAFDIFSYRILSLSLNCLFLCEWYDIWIQKDMPRGVNFIW